MSNALMSATRLVRNGMRVCLVILAGASAAHAAPVDFSSLEHGETVTTQFQGLEGFTVSANSLARSFDLAIAFDTSLTGTADPDLEGPSWSGGNLPTNTVFGRVLILAENNVDNIAPMGRIDSPDDEGDRPAGDLIFQYSRQITLFGCDLLDVEGPMEEAGRFTFFRNGVQQGFVTFAQLVSAGTFFDPTIQFGDHTANRIKPITAAQLGVASFDRVEIRLGGSGAVDNVVVPEPASIGMIALIAIGAVRRRRA